MYVSHVFSFCLVICLAQVHGATNSSDEDNFIDLKTKRTVNIKQCKTVPCLVKCCPMKQILLKIVTNDTEKPQPSICINNTEEYGTKSPFDYSREIYNKDIKRRIVKTKKKLTDFTFIFNEKYLDLMSCCLSMDLFAEPRFVHYLTEDGRLFSMRYNYYNNWMFEFDTENFCFENEIKAHENGSVLSASPKIAFFGKFDPISNQINRRAIVSAYGMLVSCWFMLLVLAVYGLLKELRNLAGMILMAYVATLTVAFLVRAAQVFANNAGATNTNQCIGVGLLFLYSLLASFTWMNVMSFDIWWSMRGFRKCREIHRRGVPVKFAWYCLYGWGMPLIPTLFIVIVEHINLKHLPNFVKPHIIVDPDECFLPEDERQLYLNGPIAIATGINIVLFLMTAYNIWRIKSGVKCAESNRNKKDVSRFGIYLKLSLVMGIGWILEVMSSLLLTEMLLWYITDIYNTLVGLFIFIIFVCKRNVLSLLCKRFGIENEYVRRWDRGSNYTKTPSTRGKRGALDSLTENSDVGDTDTSATEHLSVKYHSTKR